MEYTDSKYKIGDAVMVAAENSTGYDLVLVCDVLHHISWELHKDILRDAAKVLKPGGYLILKDWERMGNPIYYVAYFMERYITGDRVRYKSADEFRMLLQEVFGPSCIKAEARIRPWKNNIAFLVQV